MSILDGHRYWTIVSGKRRLVRVLKHATTFSADLQWRCRVEDTGRIVLRTARELEPE